MAAPICFRSCRNPVVILVATIMNHPNHGNVHISHRLPVGIDDLASRSKAAIQLEIDDEVLRLPPGFDDLPDETRCSTVEFAMTQAAIANFVAALLVRARGPSQYPTFTSTLQNPAAGNRQRRGAASQGSTRSAAVLGVRIPHRPCRPLAGRTPARDHGTRTLARFCSTLLCNAEVAKRRQDYPCHRSRGPSARWIPGGGLSALKPQGLQDR